MRFFVVRYHAAKQAAGVTHQLDRLKDQTTSTPKLVVSVTQLPKIQLSISGLRDLGFIRYTYTRKECGTVVHVVHRYPVVVWWFCPASTV